MSPRLVTFLYEAVNFIVLAMLLGWLFFKPARQALEEYRRRQEEALQNAEKIRADAERLHADIDAERAALNDELNRLRTEELAAARRQVQQLLAEADALAARKQTDAIRRVRHLEETQSFGTGASCGRRGCKCCRETARADQQPQSGVGAGSLGVRRTAKESRKDALGSVRIETARPLLSEDRASIEALLNGVVPAAHYHVNESLQAGIRIWTAQGLIDASLAGLSLHAEQVLRAELNHHPAQSEAVEHE